MIRLLNAEFSRLFHSFIFRLGVVVMAGISAFLVIMESDDIKRNPEAYSNVDAVYLSADSIMFIGTTITLIAAAILVSIFVGTEYSDGTMRNKFISGYTRISVYFSKLIVCAAASAIMNIISVFTMFLTGNIFLEKSGMPLTDYLLYLTCGTLFLTSLSAMFLILSMSIDSKSTATAVLILFSFILLFAATFINTRLNESEYYATEFVVSENGEYVPAPPEKNPNYLSGTKRKVYETLFDFLPSCHLYRTTLQERSAMSKLSVYAAGELIIFTAAGLLIFKKKDLK